MNLTRFIILMTCFLLVGGNALILDQVSQQEPISISMEMEGEQKIELEEEKIDDCFNSGQPIPFRLSAIHCLKKESIFYHPPTLPLLDIPPEV